MLPDGSIACGTLAIVGLLVWTVGREEHDASMRWDCALTCVVFAFLSLNLRIAPTAGHSPDASAPTAPRPGAPASPGAVRAARP